MGQALAAVKAKTTMSPNHKLIRPFLYTKQVVRAQQSGRRPPGGGAEGPAEGEVRLHLCETMKRVINFRQVAEVAASEGEVWRGVPPSRRLQPTA